MGGQNKAYLEIEGESFLERTVNRLRPLFEHLMIVGHDTEGYRSLGLPVHPDLRPGNGALGGLHTALSLAPSPKVFCVACDMPFLTPDLVSYILSLDSEEWDIVIPRLPEGLEPLCAVYSAQLAAPAGLLLNGGEGRIRAILEGRRTRFISAAELQAVDPHLVSFLNVNTPGDLERALGKMEAPRS